LINLLNAYYVPKSKKPKKRIKLEKYIYSEGIFKEVVNKKITDRKRSPVSIIAVASDRKMPEK